MRRFFISKKDIKETEALITGKEAHHLKDVIRLKPGDMFIGFDGSKNQYTCRVRKVSEGKIEAVIEKKKRQESGLLYVTLVCAIPKKAKIDDIVQKATELGVSEIIPIVTERTIVKIDKRKQEDKIKRWERIALESSKQCGASAIPKISAILDFKDAVKKTRDFGLKIIPCLYERAEPIKEVVAKKKSRKISILIGPEGDFTEDEVRFAASAGYIPVSLGELVLRVDTACYFSISAVMLLQRSACSSIG